MALISLAETKTYLNVSDVDSDGLIAALIPTVTNRLWYLTNNPFTTQPLSGKWAKGDSSLFILPRVEATFDASSLTVTAKGENFASAQFADGQDILISGSYVNDGYFEVSSVSTSSLTVLSGYSFVGAATGTHEFADEASGATITFAVVRWPPGIKPIAASLIQYDYQERGTWSDSEAGAAGFGEYGYPLGLLRSLQMYTRPRYGTYVP